MKAIMQLALPLILLSTAVIVIALLVGDHLPGEDVGAFTTNSYKTRSMYVFDVERGLNFYVEISGHEDELPVWSAQARGVVFYPRHP